MIDLVPAMARFERARSSAAQQPRHPDLDEPGARQAVLGQVSELGLGDAGLARDGVRLVVGVLDA
jgi:hypothetical protein